MRAGVFIAVLAAAPAVVYGATKPGLEGAQDLFRQNRWEDARAHLRGQWAQIPEKDRGAATFLIGRSYAREAEFYRALRLIADETGLEYLGELTAAKTSRGVPWIPLFTGLYQVDAEKDEDGAKQLVLTPGSKIPAAWTTSARLRRSIALRRLGRPPDAGAGSDATPEGRFCTLLATGTAEAPAALPAKDDRRGKILAAAVLFRAGRASDAEGLLNGADLDSPDVEDTTDPKKLLRFHDPIVAAAWERIGWERAVVALTPLTTGAAGPEKALAQYYVGLSLFRLGADGTAFLKDTGAAAIGAELQASAKLLQAASSWKAKPPAAGDLTALWDATQAQPDAVLWWDDLRRPSLAKLEPFAGKLDARLKDLLSSLPDRPSGALVGRWGLARLRRGEDAGALVTALSEYRDKSNKNKLEWNDPLLLLALSVAHARDQEYAQSLETLFELSKTLPGLRPVQWNLQGIYAARQKAGGEARISQ
jgi:hypothetical protein